MFLVVWCFVYKLGEPWFDMILNCFNFCQKELSFMLCYAFSIILNSIKISELNGIDVAIFLVWCAETFSKLCNPPALCSILSKTFWHILVICKSYPHDAHSFWFTKFIRTTLLVPMGLMEPGPRNGFQENEDNHHREHNGETATD